MRYIDEQAVSIGDEMTLAATKGTRTDDHLKGHGGDDHLRGRAGDDTILGRGGEDVLKGGRGNDHVRGGAGDDTISGGQGRDHLSGGAGDDLLRGGRGADHLTGGAGADQFFVAGDGKMDTVTDFNLAEGDRINAVGFKLLGLHVDAGLGVTTATFDRNNDGIADASIKVNGVLTVAGIIFGNLPAHPHEVVPAGALHHDGSAGGVGDLFLGHQHASLDHAHLAIA